MAVSYDDLIQRIDESGLMTEADVRAFVESLPEDQRPADGEALAKKLVEGKKLTPFQAQQLWKGRGRGLVLGTYAILSKLGQGGMGEVYKAQHQRMQRVVALKILPAAVTKDQAVVQRFEREVIAAAKLSHPNIVTAYDANEDKGVFYLVMEYVEGKDLSAIVKKQGPTTVAQAVDFILQAARGLEYAHKNGVVHRDIKPANLLLDKEGTVKILDMGLARIEDDSVDAATQAGLTGTGTIMGTIDYMSPEQAMDTRSAGPQADIYSLGAALYFLLIGTPTISGDTLGKKMHALMTGIGLPQSISEKRDSVPETLDAVFAKMTARELSDRYQSMTEVIVDLEAVQSGGTLSTTESAGVAPVTAERSEESAINSFVHGLEDGTSPTANTVIAKPEASVDADTFASSVDELTRPALSKTVAFGAVLKEPKQRNLLIGGSVAVVLVLGAIIWGFGGGNRDEPDNSVTAGKDGEKGASAGETLASGESPGVKATPPPAVAPFDEAQAKAHQQAWADYLGLPVEKEIELPDGAKMTFMLIPPGEFLMGATDDENSQFLADAKAENDSWALEHGPAEVPQHRVRITRPFYLGKYEVTQEQWQTVMENNPSTFTDSPSHPVEQVAWKDIQPFLEKVNARLSTSDVTCVLPTEAQWEFACRAGATTPRERGDKQVVLDEYCWHRENSRDTSHPVGQLKANSFGLFDMYGNVWEWCADSYAEDYYALSPPADPSGPVNGIHRIYRGGSWFDRPLRCRSTLRGHLGADRRVHSLGFRLAMTIDTENLQPAEFSLPQARQAPPPVVAPFDVGIVELLTSPNYEWTEPENLGPNVNSEELDASPTVSADGLCLVFTSSRGGDRDLYECRRNSVGELWGPAKALDSINIGNRWEHASWLSADGLSMLFVAAGDLWQSRRATRDDPWEPAVELGPEINSEAEEGPARMSADGLTLFFSRIPPGGGKGDVWQARRRAVDVPWEEPIRLGPTVNTIDSHEDFPQPIADSKSLLYHSSFGAEGHKLYLAEFDANGKTRVRLIDSPADGTAFSFIPDLQTLVFESARPGGQGDFDIWMTRRVPKKRSIAANAPPPAVAPFDEAQAKAHQKAWADYLGLPVEKEVELPGGAKMAFVLIPPGEFLMGASEEEQSRFPEGNAAGGAKAHESPQHRVRITRPYYLGKYEVTQAQWQFVMGSNPSTSPDSPDHPVDQISWNDTQPFLEKLNTNTTHPGGSFSLPTEAQWEYSCRAGTTTPWSSGNEEVDLEKVGWILANSEDAYHAVGTLRGNSFGLHDMHGGVWEWCGDAYSAEYYAISPLSDPFNSEVKFHRVNRGGGRQFHAATCRSAYRGGDLMDRVGKNNGLRLVLTIDTAKLRTIGEVDGSASLTPTQILISSDWEWTEPENLGPNINSEGNEGRPWLSPDRLRLYFNSPRGGLEKSDIWMAERSHESETFRSPKNLGTPLNSSPGEWGLSLTDDELTILFISNRARNDGANPVGGWIATRTLRDKPFGEPRPLDTVCDDRRINQLYSAYLSGDGLDLIVSLGGGVLSCSRSSTESRFRALQPLSSNGGQLTPLLTSDGLIFLYASGIDGGSEGVDRYQLWMSQRESTEVEFRGGRPLSSVINDGENVRDPYLTPDGRELFFSSNRRGGLGDMDIWMSRRVPKNRALTGNAPLPGDSDRELAEWLLTNRENVVLYLGRLGTKRVPIGMVADLPEGSIEISSITFGGNQIVSPELLERISKAKYIRALNFECGDELLARVAELFPNLYTLHTHGEKVTGAGLANLRSLRGLHDLALERCAKLGNDDLRHLAAIESLNSLTLSGSPIDDGGLAHLKPLSHLNYLELRSTNVAGPGLEEFVGLTKPDRLILVDCRKIDDSSLKSVAKLTQLRFLDLKGTKVTAAGVAELQKALPDCKIEWDGKK